MAEALDRLLDLLDLEQIEENIFRGLSPKARTQRVFGGQVLGQALAAAIRTSSRHAIVIRSMPISCVPAIRAFPFFMKSIAPATAGASPPGAWWRFSMACRFSTLPPRSRVRNPASSINSRCPKSRRRRNWKMPRP